MEYQFKYTNAIVKFLQEISLLQGEVNSSTLSSKIQDDLLQIAKVDSVHYSSKIEGNPLTLEQVTAALYPQQVGKSKKSIQRIRSGRNLKEVLNYSKARSFVHSSKFQFRLDELLATHRILMNGIIVKSMQGKLRASQNVIRDSQSNKIVYMPPEHADVKELTTSLMQWLRKSLLLSELSPLILSGLFHFQFESIHPFMDGNGRIGRLLSHAVLFQSGFDFVKYGAIEKFHEMNRSQYYEFLHKFQGGLFYDIPTNLDLTLWIEYWLQGLHSTASEAVDRMNLKQDDRKILIFSDPSLNEEKILKAIQLFKRFKKLKASEFQDLMSEGRTQAVEDLNYLVESNIIKRFGGGRSTVYILIEKAQK